MQQRPAPFKAAYPGVITLRRSMYCHGTAIIILARMFETVNAVTVLNPLHVRLNPLHVRLNHL